MDISGIGPSAASRAARAASADPAAVAPVRPVPDRAEGRDQPSVPQQSVPQQSVPSTAAALPVAETALRRVLASQGTATPQNPTATALDLLRSVEALLRASAPAGTPSDEIGAAAARLVERQGLLARLTDGSGQQNGPQSAPPPGSEVWTGTVTDGAGPSAVDTRL